MGLPGDGDTLELTVNEGREEPYDLGDGYHVVPHPGFKSSGRGDYRCGRCWRR